MRRYLMIVLVVLPAGVLIAIVAQTTPSSLTHGRVVAALECYLQYRAPFSTSSDLIQQIIPAESPRSFTRQMSKGTLDYLQCYYSASPTMTNPAALPVTYTASLSQTSPVSGSGYYARSYGSWPLAYPPDSVWCVRLKPDGDFYPTIVFVALHEDDYHMQRIVHEPAASTAQQLKADLTKLGCAQVEQP